MIRPQTAPCGVLALLLLGSGCATLEKAFSEEGVVFKPTARGNFEAGEEALTDKNWEEAVKYFGHVKTKFPYSKYAVLASLRTADAHFGDEKYLEAIDAYRSFAKLHPKHEQVPYAAFKVAECYFERMPEEWFFLPPVEEKDATPVLDAQASLRDFLGRYPDDANAKRAKDMLNELQQRLVSHELYAADFYRRQGRWRAVAWRAQTAAERFPESTEAPGALLRAAEAYEELGEGKAALRVYQSLSERYPASEQAKTALERVTKGVAHPDADERSPNDSAETPAPAETPGAKSDDGEDESGE
ncbi:MAG: outer membrane protein assembly factor BamD [Pseudomonadota bacterium]